MIQGEIEPPKVRYCVNKENWASAKKLFETFFAYSIDKNVDIYIILCLLLNDEVTLTL